MTPFDPVKYKIIERQVYSMTATSYEKYGSKTFEAYAAPLLESAGLKQGQHVLDIACGPGIPSLAAAGLVGPNGSVTGVDLAPGMVELARKKAEEQGLKNVIFQEADGEALPFPDESFDVVLCNHGLVHMTDRTKALHEMQRVLKKKDGVLALSVWSTPDRALPIGIVAAQYGNYGLPQLCRARPCGLISDPKGSSKKHFLMQAFKTSEQPDSATFLRREAPKNIGKG